MRALGAPAAPRRRSGAESAPTSALLLPAFAAQSCVVGLALLTMGPRCCSARSILDHRLWRVVPGRGPRHCSCRGPAVWAHRRRAAVDGGGVRGLHLRRAAGRCSVTCSGRPDRTAERAAPRPCWRRPPTLVSQGLLGGRTWRTRQPAPVRRRGYMQEHAVEPDRGSRELRELGAVVPPGEQFPRLPKPAPPLERGRRSLARLRFVSLLRPVGPLPLIVVIALCLPAAISVVVSLGLDVAHSQRRGAAAARPGRARDARPTGPATWPPTGASPA